MSGRFIPAFLFLFTIHKFIFLIDDYSTILLQFAAGTKKGLTYHISLHRNIGLLAKTNIDCILSIQFIVKRSIIMNKQNSYHLKNRNICRTLYFVLISNPDVPSLNKFSYCFSSNKNKF